MMLVGVIQTLQKPGYPPRRFLTSGITSFSLGYNSPNDKLKTPLRN